MFCYNLHPAQPEADWPPDIAWFLSRFLPRFWTAACPDGTPSIFNLSISQSVVPTFFKMSIVPVLTKSKVTELNDYCPVAITSVIMQCFQRLESYHLNLT